MQNIVVLSSIQFIFRFLPAFLIVYYLVPERHRNGVLFFGSILFYAAGTPVFTVLLLGLTLLNYLTGVILYYDGERRTEHARKDLYLRAPEEERRYLHEHGGDPVPAARGSAALLAVIVTLDAGVLALCKVLALKVDASLLPLGLSFYIFKMISYQADLYRGKIEERPGFFETAAYFVMFPQITQGPIMRYGSGFGFRRRCSWEKFEEGLVYIVLGLGCKVLIADRIAILWNEILKIGYESISTPLAWLGAYGYTFELYYDFWGYSLIAGGVGCMLGFPFIENFMHPYAAASISDFYRRWHATLGSWFRDYVYIPMGGSRVSRGRNIFNLMTVWLLTGFWHGGTMNFVIWGLVIGCIIVMEKFPLRRAMQKTQGIGRFHVLVIIPLTWVVFAITDLKQLGTYFGRLFPFFGIGQTVNSADFARELSMFWPLFAASVVFCIPAVYRFILRHKKNPVIIAALAGLFWWCVYYMANSSGNTFLYFSF